MRYITKFAKFKYNTIIKVRFYKVRVKLNERELGSLIHLIISNGFNKTY